GRPREPAPEIDLEAGRGEGELVQAARERNAAERRRRGARADAALRGAEAGGNVREERGARLAPDAFGLLHAGDREAQVRVARQRGVHQPTERGIAVERPPLRRDRRRRLGGFVGETAWK